MQSKDNVYGNSKAGGGVTGKQLRRLLERAGFSQRAMAKAIGIDERSMRRHVAAVYPAQVPKVVELAVRYIAESTSDSGGK